MNQASDPNAGRRSTHDAVPDWGNDIPDMLRNGDWNYGIFTLEKQHRPGVIADRLDPRRGDRAGSGARATLPGRGVGAAR